MTQAFNLAQLANKVNTSGQLDASSGLVNAVPVANGGTALTSVGASGNVLTSNGTTWVSSAPAVNNGTITPAKLSTGGPSWDTSGNLQFNSGYGSMAVAYGCRAWVNFNGFTGGIRGQGNVSSVTRNSGGDYTINFTTAMPDANYGFSGNSDFVAGTRTMTVCLDAATGQTTTSIRIKTFDGFNIKDGGTVTLSVFR